MLDVDTISDIQWLVPGVDGRARISLFLGIIPLGSVTLESQIQLAGLHFRFLQAEKIGIQFVESFFKAFILAGAQAVYIPGDKFHTYVRSSLIITAQI